MPSFSVILIEPMYEGNIGSVARVMKNFGFSRLILVNPPKLGGPARAMSMHARDVLEGARVASDFESVKGEFDFLIASSAIIGTDRNSLRTPVFPEDLGCCLDVEGEIGIVFGREDRGLSNEEIEVCDIMVTIPASRQYPTLNLSQSVAIILYELSKQIGKDEKYSMNKFRKADLVEKKVLLESFDDLVELAHKRETDAKLAKKTFRHLVGRSFISGKESFTLIGLFKRAARRIRENSG